MIIYSETIPSRLKYSCLVFFKYICRIEYQLTSDKKIFTEYRGAKVNYSNNPELSGIQIIPAELLFEKGMKKQILIVDEWNDMPTFYPTDQNLLVPFDILAASFYLLSRYEEYLTFEGDNHGRFMAKNSFAFQQNFLHFPIIDQWAMNFKKEILRLFPDAEFEERHFEFLATIDVDSAFAYKNKGFVRVIGGFVKDVLAVRVNNFNERLLTILGKNKDPYDTYDLLNSLHTKHKIKCIFFFLLADFGKHDKNLPHSGKRFQELIKTVANSNEIGIHPGYQSNFERAKIEEEISRLSTIVKKSIIHSRQHYLMLKFPDTFNQLIENGIKRDYTMGYADYPGFRAGTCSAFPFYDLANEKLTELIIHPFAVMDATLNRYRNESPDQAIISINILMDEVKKVDGTFISLWHNESLSEKWNWQGWRRVYEEMLKMI